MSTYRKTWACCGDTTETAAWEPTTCPFCEVVRLKELAQLAAPADLVRRLLADHQRVEPHHAHLCALCREAQAAIDGQPAQGERQPELSMSMFASRADLEAARKAQGERQPDDANDAARWRALLNSARIRPLGAAGLREPEENHYAHLGLELWTVFGRDLNDAQRARLVKENVQGQEWLIAYADIAELAQQSRLTHNERSASLCKLANIIERVNTTTKGNGNGKFK